MAKLSIRCLLKTSRWIIVSPFPPRFLNRDASFFDVALCLYALWPRRFRAATIFRRLRRVCAARLALSLPRRLDYRVSSSFALSEARRIFDRYLSLVYCVNVVKRIRMLCVTVLSLIGITVFGHAEKSKSQSYIHIYDYTTLQF